jgi:hypothetical protein
MTLNFEAGYILAIFLRSVSREFLQPGPGPYMLRRRHLIRIGRQG